MIELIKIVATVLVSFYSMQLPKEIPIQPTLQIEYASYTNISLVDFDKVMLRSNGENGFNDEATYLTACTIINRQRRGYGNGILDEVLNAYYAPDVQYTQTQYDYVLSRIDSCPKNILYALSYDDILYLGFQLEDADFIAGDESCNYYGTNKSRCAYFYSRWAN